jgi:hypothetical protein
MSGKVRLIEVTSGKVNVYQIMSGYFRLVQARSGNHVRSCRVRLGLVRRG